jgi:DNA-binding Xre family transcriptional regulator
MPITTSDGLLNSGSQQQFDITRSCIPQGVGRATLGEKEEVRLPTGAIDIDDFVAELEQDQEWKDALAEGRRWGADTFYGDEGDTLRVLRLRKGLSQASLAKAIGTSQSHIARIEHTGADRLYLQTCRRLCEALDIDLNTLDRALRCQETAANKKTKP